jgi:gamma-glutamylputrescine oxidase
MVLTGIAGKLVAEAMAGTAGRFDVFTKIPHRDFPAARYSGAPPRARHVVVPSQDLL